MLKKLENLTNPAALDGIKNKLIGGSEKMDQLSNPKDHKRDSDISM